MAPFKIHPIVMGSKVFDNGESLSPKAYHGHGDGSHSPGTSVNPYEAYDILVKVKEVADILIPLHEPKFAAMEKAE